MTERCISRVNCSVESQILGIRLKRSFANCNIIILALPECVACKINQIFAEYNIFQFLTVCKRIIADDLNGIAKLYPLQLGSVFKCAVGNLFYRVIWNYQLIYMIQYIRAKAAFCNLCNFVIAYFIANSYFYI